MARLAVKSGTDGFGSDTLCAEPDGTAASGHAFSAIVAHNAARAAGGSLLLRIEDSDVTRCRPEFVAGIFEDLAWLGVSWDAVAYQSDRFALYDAALAQLRAPGAVYPCFCSRADIAREVAASLSAPQDSPERGADGLLYPGTCRRLDPATRTARLAVTPHSWRLDSAAALALTGPLDWEDAVAGRVAVDPGALGDVILKGKDRPASYHLAVVIDDAAQGINLVVRGQDIFASTHTHRILQALLGLPVPRYHHHALVVDAHGTRLAKRNDAPTLESVRLAGADGPALADALRAGQLPIGFGFATH